MHPRVGLGDDLTHWKTLALDTKVIVSHVRLRLFDLLRHRGDLVAVDAELEHHRVVVGSNVRRSEPSTASPEYTSTVVLDANRRATCGGQPAGEAEATPS